MQVVYNDLTRSNIMPFDKEKIEELFQLENVNHIDIFQFKPNIKREDLKSIEEITLENKIKAMIDFELKRRDILSEYNKLNNSQKQEIIAK